MLHWTSQLICLELNLKLNDRSEPDDFLGLFGSPCGYPIALRGWDDLGEWH